MDFVCIDENGHKIDYSKVETVEQNHARKFIKKDDVVLELGARYGGVSLTIDKILLEPQWQLVSVEPDKRVISALRDNRFRNGGRFQIIEGVISNKPMEIKGRGFGTYTVGESGSIKNYPIPLMPFNVLVADCEGFLETFYNENKEWFKSLRLILFEKDRPQACDYDYLVSEFIKLGFKPVRDSFHSVFIK